MNKLIGASGSILLAFCGFPAMMDVINKGHADGYSVAFILMWWLGEALSLVYVLNKDKDLIQILNYAFNLTFISIIVYYML
jgi:lipid-A-disaccharide synthase-like uncharacterized protein